jgi:hypothetical protein
MKFCVLFVPILGVLLKISYNDHVKISKSWLSDCKMEGLGIPLYTFSYNLSYYTALHPRKADNNL